MEQPSSQSLLEENRRLSEEIAQCKADKEFVWSLWKQLQQQSPDIAATVDMVVTRERLKSEQRNQKVLAILQTKDKEIANLQTVVDAKQQEIADQKLRQKQAETEATLLERKLEAEKLETQRETRRVKEVLEECEGLKQRCSHLEEENQRWGQSEEVLRQQILRLEEEVEEKRQMAREYTSKEQQLEALQHELADLGVKMTELSAECSSSIEQCQGLDKQLRLKHQQLLRTREAAKKKDSEIKQFKDEVSEVRASRDAWANHTTLQNSTIQKLQADNGQLKADIASKEKTMNSLSQNVHQLSSQLEKERGQRSHYEAECQRLLARQNQPNSQDHSMMVKERPRSTVEKEGPQPHSMVENDPHASLTVYDGQPMVREGSHDYPMAERERESPQAVLREESQREVARLSELLEKTERDLFETRTQLEAKNEELQGLRTSHDRRLQRMRGLQNNHKLVLKQLKTYETRGSPQRKSPLKHTGKSRALKQENSDAVWGELFHFRRRCQELDKQVLFLGEERDTLQTHCLRSQTTITELRACLQHEKDDLERKVAAIADMESLLSTSSTQEHRVAELEDMVGKLQHEKKELLSQCKALEQECYQVREDAAQMQSAILKMKHELQLRNLTTLSKATMTESLDGPDPKEPIPHTDSATQVDLTPVPQKPEMKDAQVSPLHPWSPMWSSWEPFRSSFKKTQVSDTRRARPRAHHRAYSDEVVLVHRRRAEDAFERVQDLSRSFQRESQQMQLELAPTGDSSPHNSPEVAVTLGPVDAGDKSRNGAGRGPRRGVKVHNCGIKPPHISGRDQRQPCGLEGSGRTSKPTAIVVTGPHKCMWQQQVKSLQQRLKTLTKQVAVLNVSKQTLAESEERERVSSEKAKREAKELNQRLQGHKATIQALQEEVHRLTETQPQPCKPSAADSGPRKTETEWKKLESERKALNNRCASLSEAMKSLEEQLYTRTGELRSSQERCARLERDVKQKRQLIEDQRQKLREEKEKSTMEQEKALSVCTETHSLNEALQHSKHKVESLQLQLKGQVREKGRLMEMLSKCQDELAHTLQQLSACEENCERRKQMTIQTKEAFQHKTSELQRQHAALLSQMESKLKGKERVVQEFQIFVQSLAAELEQKKLTRESQKSRRGEGSHQPAAHDAAISSRVREIARAALSLSDLEVDEFFSGMDAQESKGLQHKQQEFGRFISKIAASKPPFAAELVKHFMDFVAQMQ